jgi:hypothetical protein
MTDRPAGAPTADDLPFTPTAPARQAFALVGLVRLDQFAGRRQRDLLALHGVGPKAIRMLNAALAARGLDPIT